MTVTKNEPPAWAGSMFQKWMLFFERDSVRRSIETRVVDPILKHILKQVFPYILLICIMFVLLLFAVLITLGVVVFQYRSSIRLPVTSEIGI
jgi:hypothetical protein